MNNADFQIYLQETGEIGFVGRTISSLVYVEGLPGAKPRELVVFETGEVGEVVAFDESAVEVLSFSRYPVRAGTRVARTNKNFQIAVGEQLLGAIIDPLGHSLDPAKLLPAMEERRSLDAAPLGIDRRASIRRPCDTGVSLVDLVTPLGKGQRELVLGDQKTGKTLFLLRALLSQVRQGAVGIYAAVGKGQIAIKQVEETLNRMKIADKVVFVVSKADDTAGLIHLTPFTAMTIAEYFRDQGRDVVLVLDDLSTHAKVHREISLLGKRFPGRNSYPGDIFYLHARLLERAGNFMSSDGKESAITCLPVIETSEGDLSGYIQTNSMSMTDGHLFFDHRLFTEGRRPAIDPFLSVTRVGRQAQTPLKQEVGRTLVTFLRDAERLHNFASFGAELGEHVKRSLAKEERLWILFDQTAYDHIPSSVQLLLFGLAWGDKWAGKTKEELRQAVQKVIYMYDTRPEIKKRVDTALQGCTNIQTLLSRSIELDISDSGGIIGGLQSFAARTLGKQ